MDTSKDSSQDKVRERWSLLARRTREMTDVMLHIAADAVADFPEDVERVERVRRFLFATLAGVPLKPPPTGDVLFVVGALIDAFDLNCDDPGVRAAIEEEIDELLAHEVVRDAVDPAAGVCECCGEPALPVHRSAA